VDQIGRHLLINVAEIAIRSGHHIRNLDIVPQTITEELAVEGHQRRSAGGVRDEVGKRIGGLNATSAIQVGVVGARELPIVPDLVNPGVVQEEQWVIGSPFRSGVAGWGTSTAGANTGHVTSEDKMDARMNTVGGIGVTLHGGVVSNVAVNDRVDIGLGESGVDHESQVRRRSVCGISPRSGGIGVGEWEERKVPPDVVGARINPERVVETTIVELEIVVGVTPGTDTTNRRRIKERGILEVGGI